MYQGKQHHSYKHGKYCKDYKKYGYKTLIIWQHELKDLNKLTKKVLRFGA